MKTIGMIGGASWHSTAEYYSRINEYVNTRLGGLHSAECLIHSVDFDPISKLQEEGRWDDIAEILLISAFGLQNCGADAVILCSNTFHKLYDDLDENLDIPVLHIADAVGKELQRLSIPRAGFCGTIYSMEEDHITGWLKDKYGVEIMIPGNEDIPLINSMIYDELCMGKLKKNSLDEFERICLKLIADSAECIITGCTELNIPFRKLNFDFPVIDSLKLHAEYAAVFALQ